MKCLRDLACAFALVVTSCWQVGATAAEWDVVALMSRLGERNSGRAEFSEKKYLAVLDKPMEQHGSLAFAPGVLEKITRTPFHERMVVEGDFLTIESGTEKRKRRLRLQRYPAIQGFIEGLRATLTGDLMTLRRFYEMKLEGNAGAWRLQLTPLQEDMAAAVREIVFSGEQGRINVIEIHHAGGDRSIMRIVEAAS